MKPEKGQQTSCYYYFQPRYYYFRLRYYYFISKLLGFFCGEVIIDQTVLSVLKHKWVLFLFHCVESFSANYLWQWKDFRFPQNGNCPFALLLLNCLFSLQMIAEDEFVDASRAGSLDVVCFYTFIKQEFPNSTVYIPSVAWGNHPAMVDDVGLKQAYSYLDKFGTGLDFESMLGDISAAFEGAVILLHV
jgi:hypothetical protein